MLAPRFTIAGLMGLVVVAAVGVAALRFASELWAGVLLIGTLAMLGAAVLGVVHRRGARRAWWQGFALFGWGYLFVSLGPWAADAVAPHLPTTTALDALFERMHPPRKEEARLSAFISRGGGGGAAPAIYAISSAAPVTATVAPATAAASGSAPSMVRFNLSLTTPTPEFFHRVGHCLWALLAATLGGLIGRAFFATSGR
ncbi:MAG TPA: hypothetical protein VG406_11335 [Isosphaeraceae bacterium]|jgi:hypothetical protein|nr:hypothetical protein [Isosphaeraceae bacterium]